ncbi:MAG: hypothetical protein ACKPE1_28630, partial [Dolichospermum sp.]
LKTSAVIKDSLDGVLFIDEAYSLGNEDKKDIYAKECLDTLCEAASFYKDRLMIIIAGYKAMNEIFKNKNIMDYARTRLIHHLVKPRKKDPPYILMMIKNRERLREKLIAQFQTFLSTKSI